MWKGPPPHSSLGVIVRYYAACAGLSAETVAWKDLGWTCVGRAETAAAPRRLLQHRYPDDRLDGDLIDVAVADTAPEMDMLVGGTPCQSFAYGANIHGKRDSLGGPGGQALAAYLTIANQRDPAWVLWENSYGVTATKDNAFGHLLGRLVGASAPLGGCGVRWRGAGIVHGPDRRVAWRVLDAQYFGIPQQRRRVFVLAAPHSNPVHPGAVLFEPEHGGRDAAPGGEAEADAGRAVEERAGEVSVWGGNQWTGPRSVAPTLTAHNSPQGRIDLESEAFVLHERSGNMRVLTTIERERLQGLPEGYTDVPGVALGRQHQMIGNAFPVPVLRWIGSRIDYCTALS